MAMIWTNIGQVLIVSIGFMLLFTAAYTTANIASKIMKDAGFDNLGYMCTAVMYLSMGVFSFFSTGMVNKIGNLKWSMVLGSATYIIWIISFCLPSYYDEHVKNQGAEIPWFLQKSLIVFIVILTAVLNGAGRTLTWVS